jgi:hypothetical protein
MHISQAVSVRNFTRQNNTATNKRSAAIWNYGKTEDVAIIFKSACKQEKSENIGMNAEKEDLAIDFRA